MARAAVVGTAAFIGVLLTFTIAVGRLVRDSGAPATESMPQWSGAEVYDGHLYGRVTTVDGDEYEGRLRFGADEEALWSNTFNGYRKDNPWIGYAPADRAPRDRIATEVFGLVFAVERRSELRRPFMARFGDLTRLEARGADLWVTLKSGNVVHLDRYAADDFADGVRVWDRRAGPVDLGERRIRSIELYSPSRPVAGPPPLYGTVRTRQGDFTGLIQWERESALASDRLQGQGPDGEVSVPFDRIRSIDRVSREGAVVALDDGREVVLSDFGHRGGAHRGTYVDDPRYGRVLVTWDALERLDFSAEGSAPAYEAFQPGQPLVGTVITRSGRRLTGRLVYDLDESETIETLDAPAQGVDYMIPFGRIATLEPLGTGGSRGGRVTLVNGEQLLLEPTGDLAVDNAGILVFPGGREAAEYVSWAEVGRIDLQHAPHG